MSEVDSWFIKYVESQDMCIPGNNCDEHRGDSDYLAIEFMVKENKRLREVLEMVEDNSKMHHPDPWARLDRLAERAREVLNKEKE